MWDKIKEIISPLAPVLGGMLGGSARAVAGTALKQLLCNNADASEDELLKAVQAATASPEQLVKIKELDNQYEIRQQEIAAQDRNSARSRQVELAKVGQHDPVPTILAIGFLIIYAMVQLYAIYNPGTQDDIIAARVQDAVMIILTYYFGSSWSSRKKDSVIEGLKK